MTTVLFKSVDVIGASVSGSLWVTPLVTTVPSSREIAVRNGEALFTIPSGVKYRFDFYGDNGEEWTRRLFVPVSLTTLNFQDLFDANGEETVDTVYDRIVQRLTNSGVIGLDYQGQLNTLDGRTDAVELALGNKSDKTHSHTEFTSIAVRLTTLENNPVASDLTLFDWSTLNNAVIPWSKVNTTGANFATTNHTHAEFTSMVTTTALNAALSGKADSAYTHAEFTTLSNSLTSVQTALSGKADNAHTHAEFTSISAKLDNGGFLSITGGNSLRLTKSGGAPSIDFNRDGVMTFYHDDLSIPVQTYRRMWSDEVGLSMPILKLTGGRFDFEPLDNKAEVRITGSNTQLGFYNIDASYMMFKVTPDGQAHTASHMNINGFLKMQVFNNASDLPPASDNYGAVAIVLNSPRRLLVSDGSTWA